MSDTINTYNSTDISPTINADDCKGKDVIVIMGPTASGKSALAVSLAKKIGGEVISADSSQVYVGLDIGSAKITQDEMQGVKHYMIDIKQPNQDFNAQEFKILCQEYLNIIHERGKIPIICGGTGLYIKSLIENYDFENTPKSHKTRENLEQIFKTQGLDVLYQKLCAIAPQKAKTINKNDKVRIIRALEICSNQNEKPPQTSKKIQDWNYHVYIIDKDRKVLYNTINNRVDKMVEEGLFEEVKSLMDAGITAQNSCFKSIGYKQIFDYFQEKKLDKQQVIDLIKQKTRNYAKRQLTFFRSFKQAKWLVTNNKLEELLNDFKHTKN